MVDFGGALEGHLQGKISLYQELSAVLKQERDSLLKSDVEALWQFSEKKQALAASIEEIRRCILVVLEEASIDHGMSVATFRASKIVRLVPEPLDRTLIPIRVSLDRIKDEVHRCARQNKTFVEDSLAFIHDFVDLVASAHQPRAVYTNGHYGNTQHSGGNSLLLNKEV